MRLRCPGRMGDGLVDMREGAGLALEECVDSGKSLLHAKKAFVSLGGWEVQESSLITWSN